MASSRWRSRASRWCRRRGGETGHGFMNELLSLILPEIALVTVACGLFLIVVSHRAASRRLAPVLALAALAAVFGWQLYQVASVAYPAAVTDPWKTVNVGHFALYVRLLASGVGIVLVLLAWPTNRDATGSASMNFGAESGEFFALMLLSIAGVFLVAVANDIILLFLAVELASIPTYIMVSISRPLPAAQEAGVKYFFLGAMAAAVMLFGFSYLYGTTGKTKLHEITESFQDLRPTRDDAARAAAAAQAA